MQFIYMTLFDYTALDKIYGCNEYTKLLSRILIQES